MKLFSFFALLTLACACIACTKERDVKPARYGNDSVNVKINEFSAAAPQDTNEFQQPADWIELYNAGNDTFKADKHKWFITDLLTHKGECALPATVIPPHGFYVVWCDSKDTVANDVHTNFKLSATGESIGLFALSGSDTMPLDLHTFEIQAGGKSEGRYPDGGDGWKTFDHPTRGHSNE